jgi:hypothetical protein
MRSSIVVAGDTSAYTYHSIPQAVDITDVVPAYLLQPFAKTGWIQKYPQQCLVRFQAGSGDTKQCNSAHVTWAVVKVWYSEVVSLPNTERYSDIWMPVFKTQFWMVGLSRVVTWFEITEEIVLLIASFCDGYSDQTVWSTVQINELVGHNCWWAQSESGNRSLLAELTVEVSLQTHDLVCVCVCVSECECVWAGLSPFILQPSTWATQASREPSRPLSGYPPPHTHTWRPPPPPPHPHTHIPPHPSPLHPPWRSSLYYTAVYWLIIFWSRYFPDLV